MKIPNPNNPVFIQKNNGVRDPNANIAGSWNCDFSSNPGKVQPSVPLELQRTEETDAALKPIIAMTNWYNNLIGGGPYWGVSSGGDVWKGTSVGTWSADSYTNSPTTNDQSDIVAFSRNLLASFGSYSAVDANIALLATNVWDADWYSTRTGTPSLNDNDTPMEVLRIGSPLLAIGDDNLIHTVTVDDVVTQSRLTLDAELVVTWIRSGTSRAFIGGVMERQNPRTIVYEWDGGDTVPTRQYLLDTRGVLSAIVMDDTLYVLTYEMEIKRLSGSGFTTVAMFPVRKKRNEISEYDGNGYTGTVAVPRAMAVLNDKILINMSSLMEPNDALAGRYTEYYPSGVWEFDPRTGSLTHKHSFTTKTTGDGDFGQWVVPATPAVHPGALMPVVDNNGRSTIVASGCYFTDTGTTSADYTGLYADYEIETGTLLKRRARIWTNQLFTADTASFFQTIALKYGKMRNSGDRIVVKYRTEEDANYPVRAAVTWTSTTTFTTTTSLSAVGVGDEVFVVCGYGGGSSAHISSLSETGGTWTVTIDEVAYGVTATNTGTVVIENWKKLASFNDRVTTYKELQIPTPASTWIQVLVELRSDGGDSPVLEEIDVVPTKQQ